MNRPTRGYKKRIKKQTAYQQGLLTIVNNDQISAKNNTHNKELLLYYGYLPKL